MNENLRTFLDVTACEDSASAEKYLELANGNLEKAIDLFFDPSINLNVNNGSLNQEEMDEALARQLAMEDERNNMPEAVPDYHETLVQPGYTQMDDSRQFRSFGADLDDDPKGLRQLFSPPPYKFDGTFDECTSHAVEKKKLLMVSLNVASDFRCHQLNRDIWKKSTITEIITPHFVFHQVEVLPSSSICNMYKVTELPGVLIIDPRTGRKLRDLRYEDLQTPAEALSTLLDVVHDYPLGKFYDNSPPRVPETDDKPMMNILLPVSSPMGLVPESTASTSIDRIVSEPPAPLLEAMEPGQTLGSGSAAQSNEEAKTVQDAHAQANNTLASLHAERMKRRQQQNQ